MFFLDRAITEWIKESGYYFDPDEYPVVRSARVKEAEPKHPNITEYDFWKENEVAFTHLFQEEFGIPIDYLKRERSVLITEDMVRDSMFVYGVSREDVLALEARFPKYAGKFRLFSEMARQELDFEDPSRRLSVEMAREMMTAFKRLCDERRVFFTDLRDFPTLRDVNEKRGLE